MGARRFGPLILLVLLGTVVIAGRLFQLQIHEHEIWASEAKNLVRHGAVVPYARGEFLDAKGRWLVRDEEAYRIEFSYRDFRRGHPLGQVAHALSSLTLRPVPLDEVWASLEDMAVELVQLTDEQLKSFVRGEQAFVGAYWDIPPAVPKVGEYRASRRSDVRYYIAQLLHLTRSEALAAARSEDHDSLFEFTLRERSLSEGQLLDDLRDRIARAREDLHELAAELGQHELRLAQDGRASSGVGTVDDLIARLEGWRGQVEDETASELFLAVTEFSAGRVDPDLLLAFLDLHWLELLLRWDADRTARWATDSRAARLASFEGWYLPRMMVKVELAIDAGHPGDAAAIVVADWRALFLGDEGLEVFSELDSLFDLRIPRGSRAATLEVLPLGAAAPGTTSFEQLAALELWRPQGPTPTAEALALRAEEWRTQLSGRLDREWFAERSKAALTRWEVWFQGALHEQFGVLDDLEPEVSIKIAKGRLDRAEERARSVLKDRGSRAYEVARKPDYDLVHLLTRYPDQFAGFVVRDWTDRLRMQNASGVPIARRLLGTVQTQGLREHLSQRAARLELARLLHQGSRSAAEQASVGKLLREVERLDELKGGDGLEGYYDEELRGHNGYRENRGLQQVVDREQANDLIDVDPIDGLAIQLTLDLDLQRAALDALEHPGVDPEPSKRDDNWLRNPTGAIVICRPNGDVLAAASFPDADRGQPAVGGRLHTRDMGLERALRIPSFQPPGSIFKPFIAAWSLDRAGLDVHATMSCELIAKGGCGFETLQCHAKYGHQELSLHRALVVSCNGYFAWLGSQLSLQDFRGLAAEFGFGQPTGVRPDRDRGGLREDTKPDLFERPMARSQHLMAANGLSVVEATPMQLARAYCGLATGRLPEMRLVDRIDGVPVERLGRPLAIRPEVLGTIRRALFDVTNASDGSASGALSQSMLGFAISGKTGSADLSNKSVLAGDDTMRVPKHTWFAGWFPPQDPVAIVVVFVNNTLQTSSHTSVWVANKLLTSPELAQFIEREVPR